MTRLKSVQFDMFFPNAQTDAVMAAMMQQLREAGITQSAITHDVGDSINLGKIAGEAVEGMKVINVPTFGEGQPFEQTFTKAYGAPQATIALGAHAYDAANVIFQAMAGGAMDGTAIKQALDTMQPYKGIIGTFHFDANGDVVGVPYALKQFESGSIVKVSDIAVD
jgi:branched-chain amino acid transport system substrate-binding protein